MLPTDSFKKDSGQLGVFYIEQRGWFCRPRFFFVPIPGNNASVFIGSSFYFCKTAVFLLRCKSSPDMALLLVYLQNGLHLLIQGIILYFQPLAYILVYGGIKRE